MDTVVKIVQVGSYKLIALRRFGVIWSFLVKPTPTVEEILERVKKGDIAALYDLPRGCILSAYHGEPECLDSLLWKPTNADIILYQSLRKLRW